MTTVKPGEKVGIEYNNDTGTWQYSVYPMSDPEYWIDSFLSYEKAKEFCDDNLLVIIEVKP